MRPARHHPPTPRVHPARVPLQGPADALSVLRAGPLPIVPTVTVLLLDEQHRGLQCLDVAGRADADTIVSIAELMVGLAHQTPLAAVVLGCVRPTGGHDPSPDDVQAFLDAQDLLADVGLDLLDCFVLDERGWASLAELSGAPWLWLGPIDGPRA